MDKTEYEKLLQLRRDLGEALKEIWKSEASIQQARREIEDQLFEVEAKIK